MAQSPIHPQPHHHGGDQGQPQIPPDQPQVRRLTAEEMRVFRECNRESFFYRSLPFAAIGVIGVRYLSSIGKLKPSPMFGNYMKYVGAVAVGYFIGKFSYLGKCREKLMKLPNSEIAEALRKNYGGKRQFEVMQEMVQLPEVNVGGGDQGYAPIREGSDMYTSPDFTVSGQNAQQGADEHAAQKPSTTYDDLRRRNREEYLRQQFGAPGQQQQQPQQPQQQQPQQQQQTQSSYEQQQKSKFSYGPPTPQQPPPTTKYGDRDFK